MKSCLGVFFISLVVADVRTKESHVPPAAKQFFMGFAEGLIGDASGVAACGKDLGAVLAAEKHLLADIKSFNVTRIVSDVEHLFDTFKASATDCRSAVVALEPWFHIFDDVHSKADFNQKLKQNFLDNDAEILKEFGIVSKVCSFVEADPKQCGQNLAIPVRLILLGNPPAPVASSDKDSTGESHVPPAAKKFFVGLAAGLIGDATGVEACGKDFGAVLAAEKQLLADIKSFNVEHIVSDVERLFDAFKASSTDCRSAVVALEPWFHIFDGVHSKADFNQKLKQNFLDNDAEILSEFGIVSKVCTFVEADPMQCGKNLAIPVRLILVGSPPARVSSNNKDSTAKKFFMGLAQGLIGDASGVAACGKDFGAVLAAEKQLLADIKSFNVEHIVSDVERLFGAFKASATDCRSAVVALEPWFHIFDDVHSKADFNEKLKQNFLDNDAEILDEFGTVSKVCSFVEADPMQCGKNLAIPVRLILLGNPPAPAGSNNEDSTESSAAAKDFFMGLAKGLLGETSGLKACAKDFGAVLATEKQLLSDIKHFNLTHVIADVEQLFSAFKAASVDCRRVVVALDPWFHIFDGVHSAADLTHKLKHNFLDNDEEILDTFSIVSKVCTFVEANAEQCGENLAIPVRLILVGKHSKPVPTPVPTPSPSPEPVPTPSPSPKPVPMPTPSPVGGKCHWGYPLTCEGAQSSHPDKFCDAGQRNCESNCGGVWCSTVVV